MEEKKTFLPLVPDVTEAWHQLLLPVRHHGESNHIDRAAPGELFEVSATDPGGAAMVITTAGYRFGQWNGVDPLAKS